MRSGARTGITTTSARRRWRAPRAEGRGGAAGTARARRAVKRGYNVPKLRLVKTCHACPEQYDVFDGDRKVGYLRLRHGFFSGQYIGETVYSAITRGDGSFHENERTSHLNAACRAIQERLDEAQEEPIYDVEDET